ncbi:Single-stranded nucleic acid binding R3H [Kalmanozyma brasiliensis GHG001]|uniref:Single-stranded nucleic acid binding R3H n=1 Tax=Kalmanozyma brasiliensis (strain GHG001) TaxID=1365824 RepID=UPI001CE8888E|nr:Single-stranded nucleic acid binding R3H [Kalmanozyma brasiliensis GHG001]KAF6767081.1 Single-stranded nucleic acid binding R3H [Kalmanozyma brasiliensis GHG001]
MTQLDGLADSLAATSLRPADAATVSASHKTPLKPAKASFASALLSGQTIAPPTSNKDALSDAASPDLAFIAGVASGSADPATESTSISSSSELVPVDDTILQAIRKRDDRIFFSQYENQMAAFVQDASRDSLELGAMNTYQRLLVHRCADQFGLHHQLDRATHCITLTKTSSTSHPSALLSARAREHLAEQGCIDPANMHPAVADFAGSSDSSPSRSSTGSPAPAPAGLQSSASSAPKSGFKIMRRDPSSNRQSPLRSLDHGDSDSDKAKARKDMTLEEREASYKAARARIFGDVATSGASSPTSATPPLDASKENDSTTEAASSTLDSNGSSSVSAASSPIASVSGAPTAPRVKKVPSSSSSVTSQDGSSQRNRGSAKSRAGSANDSNNDDMDFSRAMPIASSSAFGRQQQSSPLGLPGHTAQGYFPPAHAPHSNPNLRSTAPAFQPSVSHAPSYPQGGMGQPMQWNGQGSSQSLWPQPGQGGENDGFPALGGSRQDGMNSAFRGTQQSSAWDWSRAGPSAAMRVGQEQNMHGVNAWAQHQSQQQYQQPLFMLNQQQQIPQGFNPYAPTAPAFSPQYTQLGQQPFAPSARSANSSRASSQRGGGTRSNSRGGARDDAMSVSSISSTTSSRSASFSGVSGSGSVSTSQPANGGGGGKKKAPVSHPSLPARPAWLSPPRASGAEDKDGQ